MRPCPHGVVSGRCMWCLAEALEHERQILARIREASARREEETRGRED